MLHRVVIDTAEVLLISVFVYCVCYIISTCCTPSLAALHLRTRVTRSGHNIIDWPEYMYSCIALRTSGLFSLPLSIMVKEGKRKKKGRKCRDGCFGSMKPTSPFFSSLLPRSVDLAHFPSFLRFIIGAQKRERERKRNKNRMWRSKCDTGFRSFSQFWLGKMARPLLFIAGTNANRKKNHLRLKYSRPLCFSFPDLDTNSLD